MENGNEDSHQRIRNMVAQIFKERWAREARNQTTSWKKWRATVKASIEYRVFHEKHQGYYIDVLKDETNGLGGKMILNVGCGYGGLEVALWEHRAKPLGCDINKRFIKIAKLRGQTFAQNELPFLLCDGHKLPFRDEIFDVVACLAVLEHVTESYIVVKEMIRVLKHGGYVFIKTGPNKMFPYDIHYKLPFATWIPGRLRKRYIKLFRPAHSRIARHDLKYYTPSQILNLIKPFTTPKKVWAKMVKYRFMRAKKPLCGPDLFLYRIETTIRRLRLSNVIVILAKLLETLSMEMDVALVAKRR